MWMLTDVCLIYKTLFFIQIVYFAWLFKDEAVKQLIPELMLLIVQSIKNVFVYRCSLVAGSYCWITHVACATSWGTLGEMEIHVLNSVLAGPFCAFSNETE